MASGSQNMTTDKARQALYLEAPNQYGYYTDQYGNFICKNDDPESVCYWHLDNNAKTVSSRYYWDTGDLYLYGRLGIGYNPTTNDTTHKLYVNGTSYLNGNTTFSGEISIGSRETTSGPSSITYSNRITIVPYFHTGGPWYIKSGDDASNAWLSIYYGSSQILRMKHDGTQALDWKGNANTASTWQTARTLTIGATGKSVNGSVNVSWSKDEILGSSTSAYFLRGDKAWSNTLTGEYITTSANGYRIKYGSYGVFLRNDGSDTYILLTASGDQGGSWNTLRPFRINNASGKLYSSNGQLFEGNTTFNGIAYFANGTTYYINNSGTAKLNDATIGGYLTVGAKCDIYDSSSGESFMARRSPSGKNYYSYATDPYIIQYAISDNGNWNHCYLKRSDGVFVANGGFYTDGSVTATQFNGPLNGNAATATKLSNTPNNTTTFLRGDNTWTNTLTGNLTLTNGGIFRIDHTGQGAKTKGTAYGAFYITFKNSTNDKAYAVTPIRYVGTDGTDMYNTCVILGSDNGTTWIGAGESSNYLPEKIAYNDEDLYLSADGTVKIYTYGSNDGSSYSGPVTISGTTITANLTGNVTGNCSGSAGSVAWTNVSGRPKIDKTTVIYQISRGATFDPIQSGYFAGMTTTSGITGDWWHILSMDWSGDDKNNWISQLALPTGSNNGIYYRTRQNGTTNAWFKCLDDNNYTNYTVTKTGSGASGTWGISITGNADTVDSEHAAAFAHREAENNFIHAGNEITMVGSAFSGDVYYNYRTTGGTNGNITGYRLCNGKGGTLAYITSNTFNGNCTGTAGGVAWGNVSGKPDTFTPASHTSHSCIELYPGSTSAGHGSFIDFHYNNSSADYTSRIIEWSSGTLTVYNNLTATKVYNAVWNDFAEYRESDIHEGGRVLVSNGSGKLVLSTKRLQAAAHVISDTFGCSVGQSDTAQTPMGVAGRVLAYPYQDRNNYKVGDAVCAAPNGTIDIMTREEIMKYPDRIIGIVDEIPNYEIWEQISTQYDGNGKYGGHHEAKVEVKGRIWIYVR